MRNVRSLVLSHAYAKIQKKHYTNCLGLGKNCLEEENLSIVDRHGVKKNVQGTGGVEVTWRWLKAVRLSFK
eukprot:Awhi_evm2s13619